MPVLAGGLQQAQGLYGIKEFRHFSGRTPFECAANDWSLSLSDWEILQSGRTELESPKYSCENANRAPCFLALSREGSSTGHCRYKKGIHLIPLIFHTVWE